MSTGSGLSVLQPGLLTTVQDFGRFGAQAWGVPVSGALDPEALSLANALVGNDRDEAALEILHLGPVLEITAPAVRVALAAYGGAATVEEAGGRWTLPPWRSAILRRGAVLRIAASRAAVCAYLAVAGGFAVNPVLGSRATFLRGGFGGWQGRALAKGDELPLRRTAPPEGPDRRLAAPWRSPEGPLRVVLGPQEALFAPQALAALREGEYTVTASSDRMGLRLDGPRLVHHDGADIVSDGTAAGAIQVPGDGKPVVLLADRPTTGGYAKIATICTADLPRAGRLRPKDRVRFRPVSLDAARAARCDAEAALAKAIAGIVPARD